jgi:hypothetical protein
MFFPKSPKVDSIPSFSPADQSAYRAPWNCRSPGQGAESLAVTVLFESFVGRERLPGSALTAF